MNPKVYYSKTNDEWSVINGAMPICAHTTKEQAQQVAKRFKLKPELVWNGETGKFETLEENAIAQ